MSSDELRPNEPGDRGGSFFDLDLSLGAAFSGRADNAVAEVFTEQAECDRLQRASHGGHLRQDIDAVLFLLDHLLQATGLALDSAQPLKIVILAGNVAMMALVIRHLPSLISS